MRVVRRAGTGERPGSKRSGGTTSKLHFLRNDNLAVSRYVGTKPGSVASKTPGGSIQFDTYEADLSNPDALFGNGLKSKKVASGGSDNSVSVAGHILSQKIEHLVNVGRSAKAANAVRIR